MAHDFTGKTDEELVALRDQVYEQIVTLQTIQAAIHVERLRRLKIANAEKQRAEAEATLKVLDEAGV